MVETGQFTTKCKGDSVIALKRQKSLWQDCTQNVNHALTTEVMPKIIEQKRLVIHDIIHSHRIISINAKACSCQTCHTPSRKRQNYMLPYLFYLFQLIKPQKKYKTKNWLQFLFIIKAAVLKQQISKFYPQILSTEDSFYIYERPLTEINVIASFCALNLQIKF